MQMEVFVARAAQERIARRRHTGPGWHEDGAPALRVAGRGKAMHEARMGKGEELVDAWHLGLAQEHVNRRGARFQRAGRVVDRRGAATQHRDPPSLQRREVDRHAGVGNALRRQPGKDGGQAKAAEAFAPGRQHHTPCPQRRHLPRLLDIEPQHALLGRQAAQARAVDDRQ